MDQQRANEAIQALGAEIVGDPGVAEHEWDSLAVAAWIDPDLPGCYGYRYRGEAWEAIVFETEDLFDLFMGLRDAMAEGEERPWVACLLTIEQADMDVEIDFEFDDPERWKITPRNMDTLIPRLRRS